MIVLLAIALATGIVGAWLIRRRRNQPPLAQRLSAAWRDLAAATADDPAAAARADAAGLDLDGNAQRLGDHHLVECHTCGEFAIGHDGGRCPSCRSPLRAAARRGGA